MPRLKDFNYQGSYAYFITICTNKKEKFFVNTETIDLMIEILKEESAQHNFKIFAYCFMADHLHLLLTSEENSSLKNFMINFKQKSAFVFNRKYNKQLWQRSYYDHIVRKEESLKEVAWYILNNPVRKGLVKNFKEYNYLGSFVFDLNEI